jgi:O-antigen/teichoic acid export membrane protein
MALRKYSCGVELLCCIRIGPCTKTFHLNVIKKLKRNTFLRNIAVLSSGSVAAQVVQILTSPVLTRLYSPADFGVYAVFRALYSAIIPCVSGKYEMAMVLPKSHLQGSHLLGISLQVALGVSTVFLILLVLFNHQFVILLDAQSLQFWIYLAPFALLLTAAMNAVNNFSNRLQAYKTMAKASVVSAISVAIISIGLGILGFGFGGLLVGGISGLIVATAYLVYANKNELPRHLFSWSRGKSMLAKRYIEFPLYNATGGLLDGFRAVMPVFFLTYYFNDTIVGFFSLATRMAVTPLALLGVSVSQVNFKKIIDMVNAKKDLRPYFAKVTLGLIGTVLLPTIILTLFSADIFSMFFGSQWREAGVYVQILMPAIAVKFVVSTLGSAIGATQNTRIGAFWKVLAFFITAAVFVVYAPQKDPVVLFKAVMVMDIGLYLLYYVVIWIAVGRPRNKVSSCVA